MRFSVATYEKLLGRRPVRAALAAATQVAAQWQFVVARNPYAGLAWLLCGWRALASVAPGTVPHGLQKTARRWIDALDDRTERARTTQAYLASGEASAWRQEFRGFGDDLAVRLKYPRKDDDPERQGDLVILKPPLAAGEKGVLLVKYSDSLRKLVAVLDHEALAHEYRLVLEPSTWGYQDPTFLLYRGIGTDVVVQAQHRPDHDFIRDLAGDLTAVRLGAGDWVDPRVFAYDPTLKKRYDIVMIASWLKLKRHALLFAALRELGDGVGRVALIGYPIDGRTMADVAREAREYGVHEKIDWFERVPHREVSRILQESRVSLMLSTREGASKAIYESLFCDVPVIVSASNIGVNRDHIVAGTGVLSNDEELAPSIAAVLQDTSAFRPRKWALANTGYEIATRRINELLRERARAAGERWTVDILPKLNAPNLRYADAEATKRARPWFAGLTRYLRR